MSAILAPTDRLVMLDPLAPRDPGPDIQLFLTVVVVIRDDDIDLLANGLISRIAIQRRRRIVPGQDLPVQILGHDRVIGVLHHRGHEPGGVVFGGSEQVG
jgi:hypothetical protein